MDQPTFVPSAPPSRFFRRHRSSGNLSSQSSPDPSAPAPDLSSRLRRTAKILKLRRSFPTRLRSSRAGNTHDEEKRPEHPISDSQSNQHGTPGPATADSCQCSRSYNRSVNINDHDDGDDDADDEDNTPPSSAHPNCRDHEEPSCSGESGPSDQLGRSRVNGHSGQTPVTHASFNHNNETPILNPNPRPGILNRAPRLPPIIPRRSHSSILQTPSAPIPTQGATFDPFPEFESLEASNQQSARSLSHPPRDVVYDAVMADQRLVDSYNFWLRVVENDPILAEEPPVPFAQSPDDSALNDTVEEVDGNADNSSANAQSSSPTTSRRPPRILSAILHPQQVLTFLQENAGRRHSDNSPSYLLSLRERRNHQDSMIREAFDSIYQSQNGLLAALGRLGGEPSNSYCCGQPDLFLAQKISNGFTLTLPLGPSPVSRADGMENPTSVEDQKLEKALHRLRAASFQMCTSFEKLRESVRVLGGEYDLRREEENPIGVIDEQSPNSIGLSPIGQDWEGRSAIREEIERNEGRRATLMEKALKQSKIDADNGRAARQHVITLFPMPPETSDLSDCNALPFPETYQKFKKTHEEFCIALTETYRACTCVRRARRTERRKWRLLEIAKNSDIEGFAQQRFIVDIASTGDLVSYSLERALKTGLVTEDDAICYEPRIFLFLPRLTLLYGVRDANIPETFLVRPPNTVFGYRNNELSYNGNMRFRNFAEEASSSVSTDNADVPEPAQASEGPLSVFLPRPCRMLSNETIRSVRSLSEEEIEELSQLLVGRKEVPSSDVPNKLSELFICLSMLADRASTGDGCRGWSHSLSTALRNWMSPEDTDKVPDVDTIARELLSHSFGAASLNSSPLEPISVNDLDYY